MKKYFKKIKKWVKFKTTQFIINRNSHQFDGFLEKNNIKSALELSSHVLEKYGLTHNHFFLNSLQALENKKNYGIFFKLKTMIASPSFRKLPSNTSAISRYEHAITALYLGDMQQLEHNLSQLEWERWTEPSMLRTCIEAEKLVKISKGIALDLIFNEENYHNEQKIIFKKNIIAHQDRLVQHQYKKMKSLIEGKNIAIVGPSPTTQDQSEEIDGFDVVIRNNASFESFSEGKGTKTTLAYYNVISLTTWGDQIEEYLSQSKAIPVVQNIENYNRLSQFSSVLTQDFIRPFLVANSSPHAIPRIIWDILKYNPKSIKVFNTTFFMNGYDPQYLNNLENAKQYQDNMALGATEHDPLQSFILCKILTKTGILTFDEEGSEILNMSLNDYKQYIIDNYSLKM